jgi:hypothetical protein
MFEVYPNPFSEETVIRFTGDNEYRPHTVEIFSLRGAPVITFIVPAGVNELKWNGRTPGGVEAAQGIYLVKVKSANQMKVRRLIKY